jgi:hypothetical protein
MKCWLFLIGFIVCCCLVNPLKAETYIWRRTFGGHGNDGAYSIIQTADNGYAIVGYTTSFGAGGADFWLVKLTPEGDMQWNKTYGGAAEDQSKCVIQTIDGGYVLIGFKSSFWWLLKVDAFGEIQWEKTYDFYSPSSLEGPEALIKTTDGGYAITGRSKDNIGNWNIILLKIDSQGNSQWNKTYGTGWASSLIQLSDDSYVIAGYTSSYGDGSLDFWLLKTDSAGVPQWNKTYGGTENDYARVVVQTMDAGYLLAGKKESAPALAYAWVVKTDSAGNIQWNKTYGETEYNWVHSAIMTTDGGYAMAGKTGGLDGNVWLVKTDIIGNVEWVQTYDGYGATRVIQTTDGGYALSGITSSYNQDFLVLKTDASGIIPEFQANMLLILIVLAAISASLAHKYLAKSSLSHS